MDNQKSDPEGEVTSASSDVIDKAAKDIVAIQKRYIHAKTHNVNERREKVRAVIDKLAGSSNEN